MRQISIALFAVLTALPGYVLACNDHASGTENKKRTVGRESAWVVGEVREVDVEAGTLTVGHEKIASLKMAAMSSMLIRARHPELIARATAGDRVKFRVALIGEEPTLTRLLVVSRP